ncbi:MAG: SGNH/GDSL hydrolase family protein [Clostridia bacterium]|nr:SGNH/GDSL hydrolase family protein [Clostridia bacterium]
MDVNKFYVTDGEKPLDNLVSDGGFCGIFRTIGIIGDSLASGEFESMEEGIRGYHDFYEYSWGKFMERTLGNTVHLFCRGGMTVKEFFDTYGASCGAFGHDKLCQAYIIALGVNDTARMEQLGDIDTALTERGPDANNPNFLSYYAGIIKRIKAKQPRAKFFLMTLPTTTYAGYEPELIDKREKWCEAIRRLAEGFSNTYVLDIRKYGPVYDQKFHDTFFLGHMRATGYLLTAKMVMSYIDYIIRKNPDDFSQVGFIGTPYSYEQRGVV